jgi:hypothetical protein
MDIYVDSFPLEMHCNFLAIQHCLSHLLYNFILPLYYIILLKSDWSREFLMYTLFIIK